MGLVLSTKNLILKELLTMAKHEGLRAWSLAQRAKLLKHRKTGTSIRANRRRNYIYHRLGPDKWAAMYKQHRTKD